MWLLFLVRDSFGLDCCFLLFLRGEVVGIVGVHKEVVPFSCGSIVNLKVGVSNSHGLELRGLLWTQVALEGQLA